MPPLTDKAARTETEEGTAGQPKPTREEITQSVTPLVDAVAEALFEVDATINDYKIAWEDVGDYRRFCYRLRAKAAIAAMREPGDKVICAVENMAEARYRAAPKMLRWYGEEVWAAGIDAALGNTEWAR